MTFLVAKPGKYGIWRSENGNLNLLDCLPIRHFCYSREASPRPQNPQNPKSAMATGLVLRTADARNPPIFEVFRAKPNETGGSGRGKPTVGPEPGPSPPR